MNLTDKRWKKKTAAGKVNDHGRRMSMAVDRHFSKPDPKNFQVKVIEKYNARVKSILRQAELQLEH